jgi:hypothetical protein
MAPAPLPIIEEPDPNRFPRWLERAVKTPIATCRVWALFIADRRRLFSEAVTASWPYHVPPDVFFALCFGLFLARCTHAIPCPRVQHSDGQKIPGLDLSQSHSSKYLARSCVTTGHRGYKHWRTGWGFVFASKRIHPSVSANCRRGKRPSSYFAVRWFRDARNPQLDLIVPIRHNFLNLRIGRVYARTRVEDILRKSAMRRTIYKATKPAAGARRP